MFIQDKYTHKAIEQVRLGRSFFITGKAGTGKTTLLKVTMFANANEEVRSLEIRSRGLRAPCREAPPRCFSWFL